MYVGKYSVTLYGSVHTEMNKFCLWIFVDAVLVLSESHILPGIDAKNLMLGLDPTHTSHEKIHSNTSAVANGNQTNEDE